MLLHWHRRTARHFPRNSLVLQRVVTLDKIFMYFGLGTSSSFPLSPSLYTFSTVFSLSLSPCLSFSVPRESGFYVIITIPRTSSFLLRFLSLLPVHGRLFSFSFFSSLPPPPLFTFPPPSPRAVPARTTNGDRRKRSATRFPPGSSG